ncbi:hypothetical protein [Kushneria phyllosphaerae]|uniref:Uncharacterized protein n=1 Tax=Kushneria phyllosphaerae TaxID=2100822 RepID=A0A2R8CQQ3_9GAMM|nr:hypothetical protein [Kushneria phyllosphaerae]SPJ35226.1 hypothetical protein KSP9073_03284 [Kushneria phyllosphaerae]
MHALDQTNPATAFILSLPRSVHRGDAINQCTSHLISAHAHDPRDASVMAVQAMAELESFNKRAAIDVESTTSYVVVVKHPDGRRMALTVNDLIGFAERQNADIRGVQAARA